MPSSGRLGIKGDASKVLEISTSGKKYLIAAVNNDILLIFEF